MKRIFISNTRIRENVSTDIITDDAFDVDNMSAPDTTGGAVYVIDVHCTFLYGKQGAKRRLKTQEQGGVVIYRRLLELVKDQLGKLKVVFYSPLSAELLTSLVPANYVLNLLPMIELIPRDKRGVVLEGWTFESALQAKIDENAFSQLNNAAENLLSGWALAGAKKIDLKGKKPLVIDDEWQKWNSVYDAMLTDSPDYFLRDKANIRAEFKKLREEPFSQLLRENLSQYDFVLSDLYLWENHETGRWKTEDFINSISGFLLFKMIRQFEPAIPVVFHTTSTKFRIYEALSALGSDGQVPKNVRPEPSFEEKADTYQLFRESLQRSTDSYSGCWLNEFYRFISDDTASSVAWWRRKLVNDPAATKEVKDLVKHAILGYKNLKARYDDQGREYLTAFFSGNEIDPIAMSASGIINNVGKVTEVLRDGNNPELQFIDNLRDLGSHSAAYHLYRLDDVKIVLALLFETLREGTKRVIVGKEEKFTVPFQSRGYAHKFKHQLLYYLHYYNNWQSFIPKELRGTFKTRIDYYAGKYYSECWKHFNATDKNTVKNQFNSIRIDSTITREFKEELIGGKLVITFRQ